MNNFFNRENITLILSIFGSVGTLITFLVSYITKRKNLKINVNSVVYKKTSKWLAIVISFENRSQLPIAITSITLFVDEFEYIAVKYPMQVGEYIHHKGKEIIDRKFDYNLKIPADISQLSALSGCILFNISQEVIQTVSTPMTLVIHSTRGSAQKIELQLNQIKLL